MLFFLPTGGEMANSKHGHRQSRGWKGRLCTRHSWNLRHRRDSDHKNELIRRLRLDPRKVSRCVAERGPDAREDKVAFCRQFMFSPNARLFSCEAGPPWWLRLTPTGCLQLCLLLRHSRHRLRSEGRVPVDALDTFFPRVRAFEAENPATSLAVRNALLGGLCEQCPAKSWIGVLERWIPS